MCYIFRRYRGFESCSFRVVHSNRTTGLITQFGRVSSLQVEGRRFKSCLAQEIQTFKTRLQSNPLAFEGAIHIFQEGFMVQWFSILVSKTNDEGSNPSKPDLFIFTIGRSKSIQKQFEDFPDPYKTHRLRADSNCYGRFCKP